MPVILFYYMIKMKKNLLQLLRTFLLIAIICSEKQNIKIFNTKN